tara:strand:+ start:215 stop:346 length:132 start_codon:yes stop_codon:yes gene_type:complete
VWNLLNWHPLRNRCLLLPVLRHPRPSLLLRLLLLLESLLLLLE